MRVRFDRAMVDGTAADRAADFTLRARNPARNLQVGGRRLHLLLGRRPRLCDGPRPRAPRRHLCRDVRLPEADPVARTSCIRKAAGPFEPLDLPADTRHLDLYYAEITLLDKNWQPQGLGRERAIDGLEMAAISLGTTREEL